MAIIYGRAESEKEILNQFHDSIKSVEDVETFHEKLKGKIKVKNAIEAINLY